MAVIPPYRLQTLLEVRQRKKEAAERLLSECLVALRREEKQLKAMELELTRMVAQRQARRREYLEKAMKGEMSALEATNTNQYLERLKEREQQQKEVIIGQQAVIRARQQDVDDARKALIAANQELKALEKHKEKWLEEVKKAREARDEETMDELAQTIFRRGQEG